MLNYKQLSLAEGTFLHGKSVRYSGRGYIRQLKRARAATTLTFCALTPSFSSPLAAAQFRSMTLRSSASVSVRARRYSFRMDPIMENTSGSISARLSFGYANDTSRIFLFSFA